MLAPRGLNPPRGAGPALGWRRRTVHLLAVAAGWALFFWGWYRVLVAHPDFSALRVLVLGAVIVVPVVTVSWILHNRGIHRRKGPRRHVSAARLDYRVDFHGLEVVADFAALAPARRVHIVIDGTRKVYRESSGAADATPLAAAGEAFAPATRPTNEGNAPSPPA